MILRRARAYLSLALFAAAIVAEYLYPQYATAIFFGLILWMVVTLMWSYGPTGRAAAAGFGRTAASRGGTVPSAPPLPGNPGPATRLDFCLYCGTALGPDSSVCPACGKSVRTI